MKNPKLTSLSVALSYIIFSYAWIIFSDFYLIQRFPVLTEIKYYQPIKGLGFVTFCGILLYLLSSFVQKKIEKQQKKIKAGEDNYRKLFLNNPMPMWVYDMKTLMFLEVNNAAIECYGYSREEFLNMNLFDIRPAKDHKDLMENIAIDNNLNYSLSGVWQHVKKNGAIIYVEISSHPIEFSDRQAKIVLAIDVSKRKEAEKEIQALIFELDNFVYRASHDLRGPLARLKGLSQVALMETQDTISRNYFNLINNAANVLDNTLLRLLSINNLKHTILEEEDVNLHQLINKIVLIKKDVIERAGISFINEISEDLIIHSDEKVLRLALQNILENSIQYRNEEESNLCNFYIRVSSHIQDKKIKLIIEDNGIGIEESQIDKIFNIFHRGTEKSHGSGLGLYIAKIAMDKIKGTISLLDYKKSHTVFELEIPVKEKIGTAQRTI